MISSVFSFKRVLAIFLSFLVLVSYIFANTGIDWGGGGSWLNNGYFAYGEGSSVTSDTWYFFPVLGWIVSIVVSIIPVIFDALFGCDGLFGGDCDVQRTYEPLMGNTNYRERSSTDMNAIYNPYGQKLWDINEATVAQGKDFMQDQAPLGVTPSWNPIITPEVASGLYFYISDKGIRFFNDYLFGVSNINSRFHLDPTFIQNFNSARHDYPSCLWGGDYVMRADIFATYNQDCKSEQTDWTGNSVCTHWHYTPVFKSVDQTLFRCLTTKDLFETISIPNNWSTSDQLLIYCNDAGMFAKTGFGTELILGNILQNTYKACYVKNLKKDQSLLYVLSSGNAFFDNFKDQKLGVSINGSLALAGISSEFAKFKVSNEQQNISSVREFPVGTTLASAKQLTSQVIQDNISPILIIQQYSHFNCQPFYYCKIGDLKLNLASLHSGLDTSYVCESSDVDDNGFLNYYYTEPFLPSGVEKLNETACRKPSNFFNVSYQMRISNFDANYTLSTATMNRTLYLSYKSQAKLFVLSDIPKTSFRNASRLTVAYSFPEVDPLSRVFMYLYKNSSSAILGYESAEVTKKISDSLASVYTIKFSTNLMFTKEKCMQLFAPYSSSIDPLTANSKVVCSDNHVELVEKNIDSYLPGLAGSVSPAQPGTTHELFKNTILSFR